MSTVYLSPSSQHFNTGYGVYGTEERRMNLLANVIEYELIRNGITTDRNNPEMTLCEIVADANAKTPQIYVALQSQSAGGKLSGAEVFYYKEDTNSHRLASDIFGHLKEITPFDNIGLTDGSLMYGGLGFYELRKTKAPSVIVAVGFHDNPKDAEFIINNIYGIGIEITKGITDYLGITYKKQSEEIENSLMGEYNGIIF